MLCWVLAPRDPHSHKLQTSASAESPSGPEQPSSPGPGNCHWPLGLSPGKPSAHLAKPCLMPLACQAPLPRWLTCPLDSPAHLRPQPGWAMSLSPLPSTQGWVLKNLGWARRGREREPRKGPSLPPRPAPASWSCYEDPHEGYLLLVSAGQSSSPFFPGTLPGWGHW